MKKIITLLLLNQVWMGAILIISLCANADMQRLKHPVSDNIVGKAITDGTSPGSIHVRFRIG